MAPRIGNPAQRGTRLMVQAYLDPPVLQSLKQLSSATGISMAQYLREAVADLLKKHAAAVRRAKR